MINALYKDKSNSYHLDTQKLELKLKEIESQKLGFCIELAQIKNFMNTNLAKLCEIEDAWLERTGAQFIYDSKN